MIKQTLGWYYKYITFSNILFFNDLKLSKKTSKNGDAYFLKYVVDNL